MKPARVFLFGDINVDVSMTVPSFPPPGQDAYAEKLSFNLGGSSTNTAIVLRQLGVISDLFGSIGQDLNGEYLLRELKSFGLNTRHLQRKAESASGQIFLPILPDGERAMYSFRGANVHTSPEDIPANWQKHADLLHLSGYVFLQSPQRDTAISLIKTARKWGLPISMDTGYDPVLNAHREFKHILDAVTLWICGVREGAILTGTQHPQDIIRAFLGYGASCVALKLGKRGCLLGLKDQIVELPALSVRVVDTTGCGDAFSAGILLSWLHGFDPESMGMLANSLGAYTASRLGSIQPGLSWSNLNSFLRNSHGMQPKTVQANLDTLLERIKKIG